MDRAALRGPLGRRLAEQEGGRDECSGGRRRPGRAAFLGSSEASLDPGSFGEVSRRVWGAVEALRSGVLGVRANSRHLRHALRRVVTVSASAGGRMA